MKDEIGNGGQNKGGEHTGDVDFCNWEVSNSSQDCLSAASHQVFSQVQLVSATNQ